LEATTILTQGGGSETYPRQRKLREDGFEKYDQEHGEDANPIREQDDAMATTIEEECGGFWDGADKYASHC